MVRLHYIDNLRWISILMLFPFHTAFIFCAGWYGYYVTSPNSSTAAHCLTVAVEPWIMPLLFCIAGLSTNFALQERTVRGYLRERVMRLLVPLLAGLVLICPLIAYFALKFHTGYTGTFAGAFMHFFSSVGTLPYTNGLSGDFSVDHLWFILFLFLFSLAIPALILLSRRFPPCHVCAGNLGLPGLVLLFVPLWLLNLTGPQVTGYTLLSYFALFLVGYSLLSKEAIQVRLEEHWALLLTLWVVLTVGVMWTGGILLGYDSVFWGSSALFVLTGWIGVLALMGAGRHLFDYRNSFADYMSAASYPVYILHQAVLVAVAYGILMLKISPALQYAAIVMISILLTFTCYEVLKKVPGIRLLFGIAGPRKKPA